MDSSAFQIACGMGFLVIFLLATGFYLITSPGRQSTTVDQSAQAQTISPALMPNQTAKRPGQLGGPLQWIALVLAVLFLLWLLGAFNTGSGNPIVNSKHHITYQVSGTARSASVTYWNAQGGTEQMDISIPWETTFDMNNFTFATISAQKSQEGGTITCQIMDNGKVWLTSTSNAAYGIASCNGYVGQ